MEIVKFPHPALLTPCKTVTAFGPELKVILDSMYDTMLKAGGIGLAANQVNLNLNMFVMQSEAKEKVYLVNPKIVRFSYNLSSLKEGCLSMPGERLTTGNRHEWVLVEYQDENGVLDTDMFYDIYAVCVQHEMDHLLGKPFFQSDSVPRNKRKELCKRWGIKY